MPTSKPCTSVPCSADGQEVIRYQLGDLGLACNKWNLWYIEFAMDGTIRAYGNRVYKREAFCKWVEEALAAHAAPLMVPFTEEEQKPFIQALFKMSHGLSPPILSNDAKYGVETHVCLEGMTLKVWSAGYSTSPEQKREAQKALQKLLEACSPTRTARKGAPGRERPEGSVSLPGRQRDVGMSGKGMSIAAKRKARRAHKKRGATETHKS